MGPNDVEVVRVFTKEQGSTIADVTFKVDTPFEVIVEAEAGDEYMTGALKNGSYKVGVTVRDLTDGTTIPVTPPPAESGTIPATWGSSAARTFAFQIAGQSASKADHCCEVLAFLRVVPPMASIPDISFVTSPLFIIHP